VRTDRDRDMVASNFLCFPDFFVSRGIAVSRIGNDPLPINMKIQNVVLASRSEVRASGFAKQQRVVDERGGCTSSAGLRNAAPAQLARPPWSREV